LLREKRLPVESSLIVYVQTTTTEGVSGSSAANRADTGNQRVIAAAFAAAGKMINNSKNLPQIASGRCSGSESSEYERKRESLDGLDGQYD
jgi:hypothetical protein